MSADGENTVLTQDDIDSLIERTAAKEGDNAPAQPAEPVVVPASPAPVESGANVTTVAASPGAGGSRDLAARIEKLEAELAKLGGARGADPKLQATVTGLTQQLQTLSGRFSSFFKNFCMIFFIS